ncbi:hypothetical protein WJR50_15265 [Catalinimonas sp. 4WD22]|uniref:hypothetical protein n=1 Tax=Catalinimonas locisalis TaxID=3133978 RepID=UPI0031017167
MNRKATKALYYEICSRVHPIKGIYQEGSTEKERIVKNELEAFKDNHLNKLETNAIERLFKSLEDQLETEEKLMNWYKALTNYYSHEIIPDTIYIKLITIATQNKFEKMQALLTLQKQ